MTPGKILADWLGLTARGMHALERSGRRHLEPGDLETVRRDAIEELALGRGTTPKRMAELLRSFLAERKRLLIKEPESEGAPGWREDVEALESPLAKPPTDEELN